jgi:hypothetical protein
MDREWEREDGPVATFAVAADGAARDAGLVDDDNDYDAEEVAINDYVSVCSAHEDRPSYWEKEMLLQWILPEARMIPSY